MKWLKGKLAYIFMIGVYFHRLVDGLNDLRYEFYNASAGVITWIEFGKQIIPTLKYHLSGEFQKKIAEIYKQEHIGLDKTEG
jgi:hypothetical protein